MDKKTLKQLRSLKRELNGIDKRLDKLYERRDNVPTVLGKVTGSSKDFPYTEVRMTVQMDEPKESDEIDKQVLIREARRYQVASLITEIEEFIAAIPDSVDRRIFELTYLEGKKQREVAEEVCLDRSRISRRIDNYLKNAHKAQK